MSLDLLWLQGVWPGGAPSAPPPSAGFTLLQLQGVWITGVPYDLPPEPEPEYVARDQLGSGKRRRDDDEAVALLLLLN